MELRSSRPDLKTVGVGASPWLQPHSAAQDKSSAPNPVRHVKHAARALIYDELAFGECPRWHDGRLWL